VAELLDELEEIVTEKADRATKATRIVQALRRAGRYRWVGIYDVDLRSGFVSNIAWDGPNAPAFPTFRTSEGLTSRAIAEKTTVNAGDVAADSRYLTALQSTRSEIIVPVMDGLKDRVVGTIDVESESLNAFDSNAQSLLEECANILSAFWTDSV
jgi:putative methionine-R-sulfoxide reductase with GAF domain